MTRKHDTRTLGAVAFLALLAPLPAVAAGDAPKKDREPIRRERQREFSGIYPHLAYYNQENECGTGAVVPWANRLWVVTYAPHKPNGSSDKLYEIDEDLNGNARPESVGGTPANRMIHPESRQLFIGPYAIDAERQVRVIPPKIMPGRLTGNARHLTDPEEKLYFATMEEGLYEVDVHSLAVTELFPDTNRASPRALAGLPGCHGKGLYSGQGRVVYANNGERSPEALLRPDVPSGCLAEWNGKRWNVVLRTQFTEVTGPGGIHGNRNPGTEPLWSIGWDHRSLILMLLDHGQWHRFRLPKASHCYDGAHGWNTEWPRIREIGENDLLMTMHGMFWRFPKTFAAADTSGISPRSTYLKVIGDFCRWNGRIIFGCDDTAKNEFLNTRKAKGNIAGPGQSHSNLWFVDPRRIDQLGPPLGRGAVWLNDSVKANQPSDPFLFAGFDRRAVHVVNDSDQTVNFSLEVDPEGRGTWTKLRDLEVPPRGYQWHGFSENDRGVWIRARTDKDCAKATVFFTSSDRDGRDRQAAPLFDGLAAADATDYSGGLVRSRGEDLRNLHFAASQVDGGQIQHEAYYELDGAMNLRRVSDDKAHQWLKKNVAVPSRVLTVDEASVLYVNDAGQRFRLPKGDPAFDRPGALPVRVDREVCTERDLFNCHGTFYELPARNAGGMAKIRPIATHNRRITDYCSYRGLLVLAGITNDGTADNPHILHSDDGRCALWVGAVDDLWQLGKPVGQGGPWKNTSVRAGEPSDPYLMTGFDRKMLTVSHSARVPVHIRLEVDITGSGTWRTFRTFELANGEAETFAFPEPFQAYWARVTADRDGTATAWFVYE